MDILGKKNFKGFVVSMVASSMLLFSGCGSSGGSTNYAEETGVFEDSPVDGLSYKTGSRSGTTSNGGKFTYVSGEVVSFYIGKLLLGSSTGKSSMTPLDIVEGADGQLTPEVINVLRLLQTLDSDGDTSNGITLAPVTSFLEVGSIDFSDEAAVIYVLSELDATKTLISAEEAIAHFQDTLANLGGTIDYIDYLGNTRTAAATPGAAEYHTGTGYGNTLLDSAENKCQNCHNELYDTWKGSMHGKSWEDPIFQSKFQDFLRTHLAKIGETKDVLYQQVEVGVGTKNMFSGAAQTCIKCHAPGAYYAGDVKVTVTELQGAATISTAELDALKATHEVNNPSGETSVIAANSHQNKVYKATFQIGHEANREGINCAFCHSMETPRLMGLNMAGVADVGYTLAGAMRVGPHGPVKAAADTTLNYSTDATAPDMNKFFRIWGPEKYSDPSNTAKGANPTNTGRAKDGRYTMANKDLDGTDGKTHFTGGPFYGPFGVTGTRNENITDETDRSAHVNPHFNKADGFNHFADQGKALCLSCHQRSAGAFDSGNGEFMELCSTWNAVTTGGDDNHADTASSPKCQKCHMERIEGTVLHQWAKPTELFTDKSILTSHFYPDDSDNHGNDNPVSSGWLNSHGFLGASKTGGDKTAAVKKIKSGFAATLAANEAGSTLTVTTTLQNKTAHMFPGAHPMRRVLTRVIVTDANGAVAPYEVTSSGNSTFGDITNTIATLSGKTVSSSGDSTVTLVENNSDLLDFSGKVADLDGSPVVSQDFASMATGSKVMVTGIPGTDATIKSQSVTNGATTGSVFNSAIVNAQDPGDLTKNFTRIYGHETGKKYDLDNDDADNNVLTGVKETFVVRPGFDSSTVQSDTRLSPNETETYTLTYDTSGGSGLVSPLTVTYKVYYMQKGANGQFIEETAGGFLDQAASDAAKHLVTEVFSATETVSF